jgi:pimeloyl-ACP methyl ester carboxylesterase
MIFKRILKSAAGENAEVTDEELDEMYRIFNTPNARSTAVAQMREVRANPVGWDVAARVRAPALVIWGRQDEWTALKYGERLSGSIPDSRLVIIEKSGHMPQWETPGEVSRLLDGFFQEVLARVESPKEEP